MFRNVNGKWGIHQESQALQHNNVMTVIKESRFIQANESSVCPDSGFMATILTWEAGIWSR